MENHAGGHNYILKRSKRRTLGIYIKDAKVEVRAPRAARKADIEAFIASKAEWIKKHVDAQEERIRQREDFKLAFGSRLSFRGNEYPIRMTAGKRAGFDGECFYIPAGASEDDMRRVLCGVYKKLASELLKEKTAAYAKIMKAAPHTVKINSARTRFGSCSTKNSINYSWKLVMAGDEEIDYVVVHELAHLFEHNHSPRFWNIVEGVLPDYRIRKLRLKILSEKLRAEGW